MALSIFHIDLSAMVQSVQNALSNEINDYEQKYNFSEQNLNQNLLNRATPTVQSTVLQTPTIVENSDNIEANNDQNVIPNNTVNSSNQNEQAITNLSGSLTTNDSANQPTPEPSITNSTEVVTEKTPTAETTVTTSSSSVTNEPIVIDNEEPITQEETVTANKVSEEENKQIQKYLEYYRSLIDRRKSNVAYQKALGELSNRFRHSFQDFDIANQDLYMNNDAMKRSNSEKEQADAARLREAEELDKEVQRKLNEQMGRRI